MTENPIICEMFHRFNSGGSCHDSDCAGRVLPLRDPTSVLGLRLSRRLSGRAWGPRSASPVPRSSLSAGGQGCDESQPNRSVTPRRRRRG